MSDRAAALMRRTPLGGAAEQFSFPVMGERRVRVASPDLRISDHAELRYLLFPEPAAAGSGGERFAATAVAVDLVLSDGTRLSETATVDRVGAGATPAAQRDAHGLFVGQWNSCCMPLDLLEGKQVVAIEVVTLGAGEPASCWVGDIQITPSALQSGADGVDLVDTRRGTNSTFHRSRGNTIPAVAVPHGFNFGIPVTHASDIGWVYQYEGEEGAASPVIQAFATSHLPSPWMGDRGVLHVMPTSQGAAADGSRDGRALPFQHADEVAKPYHYRVSLGQGCLGEITTTDHVVLMRFTLPDGGGLIFDQLDDRGGIRIDRAEGRITGFADAHHDDIPANVPRMFFAAVLDNEIVQVREGAVAERPNVSAAITLQRPGVSTLRIATSFLSLDQALHSLEQEAPSHRGFDEIVDANRAQWQDLLGRFSFEGADAVQQAELYASLYRLFLYPNNAAEREDARREESWRHADTANPPVGVTTQASTGYGVREGQSFVNNGFWDTYRTTWPAYALFDPERAATLLDGFVEHYRASGWMARWSGPGPAPCMVGTSSDVVTADLVMGGVSLRDAEAAYDAALRNATTVSGSDRVGRGENASAPFRGFVSTATPEGLSWSLEGSLNDFGIAQLSEWAAAHAAPDDPRLSVYRANARWFRSRALSYRALFDAERGFFIGRNPDGSFRDVFDPAVWGGDYTETNAWGMAFSVPHDGNGLAALYGGRAGLEAKLDAYFSTPESGTLKVAGSYGRIIHEMTEARDVRRGMFGLSNQPAHHIPFMYAFTGAPHKAQAIVRDSVRRLFGGSDIGQGYPGDEDNGEMSAWYLFASMGLYPLTPGAGEFLLTSPAVSRSTVRLSSGAVIDIHAHAQAPENVYIQSVTVNGEVWTKAAVPIALLRAGVRIDVVLGPEPSGWASRPEDMPFSLTAHEGSLQWERDLTAPADAAVCAEPASAAVLFDDEGAASVMLAPGDVVGWRFRADASVAMYTVSPVTAGTASWVIETSEDGDDWHVIDQQNDVSFAWDMQTRAFELPAPQRTSRLRIRSTSGLRLRQLEYVG